MDFALRAMVTIAAPGYPGPVSMLRKPQVVPEIYWIRHRCSVGPASNTGPVSGYPTNFGPKPTAGLCVITRLGARPGLKKLLVGYVPGLLFLKFLEINIEALHDAMGIFMPLVIGGPLSSLNLQRVKGLSTHSYC